MPTKNKINTKRKNNSINGGLSRFLKLQLIAFIVYLTFFVIFSAVSVSADLSKAYVYYVSLALFAIASFLIGFLSAVKTRKNGLITGVTHALPMNLIFIIVSLILNGFKADFRILISLAVMIIASAVGGIISVNIKVRK